MLSGLDDKLHRLGFIRRRRDRKPLRPLRRRRTPRGDAHFFVRPPERERSRRNIDRFSPVLVVITARADFAERFAALRIDIARKARRAHPPAADTRRHPRKSRLQRSAAYAAHTHVNSLRRKNAGVRRRGKDISFAALGNFAPVLAVSGDRNLHRAFRIVDDRQIDPEVEKSAAFQFKEIVERALAVDAPAVGIERSSAAAQKRAHVRPLDVEFAAVEAVYVAVERFAGAKFHAVGKNVVDRLHFDGTHILPFRSGRHVPGPEPNIERRLFGGIDEGVCHLVRRAGLYGEIHIETARTSRQDTFAAGLGAIRQNVQRRRFVRDGLRVPRFAVFGKRTCYSSRKENGERKRHKSYLFYRRMIAVYGNT